MKMHKLWEYLIQIFIVVFGVFLGMLLNEWNIERKAVQEQKLALSRILNELDNHQNHLNYVIPYHEKIIHVGDSLISSYSESDLSKPFLMNGAWSQVPQWQGIKMTPLQTSSFESAKISNVLTGIDSDLLNQISAYYEKVTLFNKYSDNITTSIFNTNSNTNMLDALFLITLIRGDIIGFEKGIILNSDKLKNELQKNL